MGDLRLVLIAAAAVLAGCSESPIPASLEQCRATGVSAVALDDCMTEKGFKLSLECRTPDQNKRGPECYSEWDVWK